MKKLITLVLVVYSWLANAQSFHAKYLQTFSTSDYYSLASSATDRSNNYFLCGSFSGSITIQNKGVQGALNNNYQKSIYLAKFNSYDSLLELLNVGEVFSIKRTRPAIFSDIKNNIILTVSFEDSISILNHKFYSQGMSDVVVSKLDSLGNYLWGIQIAGQYDDGVSDRIGTVDKQNNIYIAGTFGGYNGSPIPVTSTNFGGVTLKTRGYQYFCVKYNEYGQLIWVKQAGANNLSDGGGGCSLTKDNGILAMATFEPSYNIYFDSTYHYTFPQSGYTADAIVKYDSSGALKWVKGIYTPNFPDIVSIQDFTNLKNNFTIAFGSYQSLSPVLVEGYGSFPPNQSGAATNASLSFLICYDSLGNVVWAKNPHTLVGSTEQPIGVAASKTNADFFLVSYFDGGSIFSGSDKVYGTGYQNVLIECMDSMGNKKWHKIIKGFPGANARDITINDNNEIIIVGNTSSNTLQCDAKKVNISSTPAMYILKLASGDVNWNDTLNGFEEVIESKEQLVIYPNPAQQSIIINHQSLVNTIVVTDVLGRVVNLKPKIENQKEMQIDVSSLTNGIYFIKAFDTKGNQLNGKFVKQ